MKGLSSPFTDHGDDRYFSRAGYRAILADARAAGYVLVPFRSFRVPVEGRPVLLLRHDMDHDLESALVLAEIEADAGVAATYFIQTACEFYNLLSPHGRSVIRRLAEMGHEIGLHYAAERYAGGEADANLAADIRLLEDLAGQPVTAAAQHIPVDSGPVDLGRRIRDDAYDPRFTQAPMSYISDSLMSWRAETPHDLIAAGRSFQLLTHPECWTGEFRAMPETMAALETAEIAAVRARFGETLDHYATLLSERAERDRRFRETRGFG